MKAIDGKDAGYAFMPGDGWSSGGTDTFKALMREYGFTPKVEPPFLHSNESLKYSRGGVIVAGEGGDPPLLQAWEFYQRALLEAIAPQLATITVSGPSDKPLSFITNSGTLDTAFTDSIPDWIMGLGVSIREEISSEWFLSSDKRQVYILRRRFLISSENIVDRIHHLRTHLPLFSPGLVAELSLGSPVAAVSRCTSPGQIPAIERIGTDTTVLLWSNVRVTLVDQVISHKQLTHKTCLWLKENPPSYVQATD
jgi:hypothetical protein